MNFLKSEFDPKSGKKQKTKNKMSKNTEVWLAGHFGSNTKINPALILLPQELYGVNAAQGANQAESPGRGADQLDQKKTKISLTALIIAIISGFFLLFILTPSSSAKNGGSITANELIFLTNQERTGRFLPALTADPKLTLAAQNKIQDIFKKQYFSHNAPDGKKFSDWVKEANYQYLIVGENLAMGFGDSQQIIEAWMQSPGHRKNILMTQYKNIGIAVAQGQLEGKQVIMVVQYFGANGEQKISEILFPNHNLFKTEVNLIIKV